MNEQERRLADCLRNYDIRLFEDKSGMLRLGGEVNRMEEATLRGPCGELVTAEIQRQFERIYEEQDRKVVFCLQQHGVDAIYDDGAQRGIQIKESHPRLHELLNECAEMVFDEAREEGFKKKSGG